MRYTESNRIDYMEFFEKYLLDKEEDMNSKKDTNIKSSLTEKIDVTSIYQKIHTTLRDSNVNLNYALKFFSDNQQSKISLKDFNQLLTWIKIKLDPNEKEAIIDSIRILDYPEFVNAESFLEKIKISSYEIVIFNLIYYYNCFFL